MASHPLLTSVLIGLLVSVITFVLLHDFDKIDWRVKKTIE